MVTRLLSDTRFQLQPNQLMAVDRPRASKVGNRTATQITFCVRGVISPLFVMTWQRPNNRSRMNREIHVRFWESPEVKVLQATRH
jgi:hypothetical protein